MLTGDQVLAARTRAGLTQQQLADQIGVTLRSVGNWERAESVPRTAESRLRHTLAAYLEEPVQAGVDLGDVSDARLLAEIARRFERGREEVGNDVSSAPTSEGEETSPTEKTSPLEALLEKVTTASTGMPPGGVGAFAHGDLLVRFFDSGATEAALPSEARSPDYVTGHGGTTLMVYIDTYDEVLDAVLRDTRYLPKDADDAATTKQAPGSGATVTQFPSAAALDPTLPDDLAARDEGRPSKTQRARERQDKETEGP